MTDENLPVRPVPTVLEPDAPVMVPVATSLPKFTPSPRLQRWRAAVGGRAIGNAAAVIQKGSVPTEGVLVPPEQLEDDEMGGDE